MHVLGLPPAFVLSQDQTLKFERRTIHQIRKPDERPAHVIVHLRTPAETPRGNNPYRKMHIVLFHPDQSSIQPKDQTDNQTVEQHKDAKQTVTHDQPSQTETRQNRQPHIPFNPTMSNSRPTTGAVGEFRGQEASGRFGCRGTRCRVGAYCPAAEAAYRPLPPNLSTAPVTVFLHCGAFIRQDPRKPGLRADLDSSTGLRASSPRARNTWIPSVIRPAMVRTLRQPRTSR